MAKARASRPNVTVNVWRYYGQKSFNSSYHMNLVREAGALNYQTGLMGRASSTSRSYNQIGASSISNYAENYRWYINPISAEFASGANGDTIYERLQAYSLELMMNIDYLDSGYQEGVIKQSLALNPNQPTIAEATERMRESEVLARYGKIPKFARRDAEANAFNDYMNLFDNTLTHVPGLDDDQDGELHEEETARPKEDPWYEVKVGLTWMVAGQDADTLYKLPFESPELMVPLDRDKYKIVWEVGRAGQTVNGAFDETLRANAYMAYMEVLAMGGNLEDAWVFGHSLDAGHTALYKRRFKMIEYSGYSGNPKEKLLVAPLATILRLFKLETLSSAVTEMMAATKNTFTPRRAMEWEFKARQWRDMILSSPKTKDEYEVRVFGNILYPEIKGQIDALVMPELERGQLFQNIWERAPIVRDRDSIGDQTGATHNMQRFHVHGIPDNSRGGDHNGLMRLRTFLHQNNAVEVFTRGESEASGFTTLLETYNHFVQRLRNAGIQNPVDWLTRAKVNFCLTSRFGYRPSSPEFAADRRWYIHRDEYVSTNNAMGFGFGAFRQVVAPRVHLESNCFGVAKISKWARLGVTARDSFATGVANTREFLINPQLYHP